MSKVAFTAARIQAFKRLPDKTAFLGTPRPQGWGCARHPMASLLMFSRVAMRAKTFASRLAAHCSADSRGPSQGTRVAAPDR